MLYLRRIWKGTTQLIRAIYFQERVKLRACAVETPVYVVSILIIRMNSCNIYVINKIVVHI